MLNLFDALGTFGNPVGHLVEIMAIAALAAALRYSPCAPPDVFDPNE